MTYVEPRPLPPGQRLVDELPVRTYGPVPHLDPRVWSLQITGETASGQPFVVEWEQLMELPQVVVEADIHCVSKMTAQDLVWGGVLVRDLLDLCPPADDVEDVVVYGQHGYSASTTLTDLHSPRALVATHLGGEPLSPERGGPARLVLPHLYAYKGPKWLREISYLDLPQRGFWESRGYHLRGDVWRQERYSYQE